MSTDVASGSGITKMRFNVPVRIERNDVLFTLPRRVRAFPLVGIAGA